MAVESALAPEPETQALAIDTQHRVIEKPELAFILIFAIVATLSWVGITLAEFHRFNRGSLLLFGLIGTAAATALVARRLWTALAPGRSSLWSWLFLIGLLVGGGLLLSPPGEYVFNGSDGSVYLNVAKIIEKTGGITFRDHLLDLVPASDRAALFPEDERWPWLRRRFPGGIHIGNTENLIVPEFFHLFPVWMAIFNVLGPSQSGLFVNVVFSVFGVVALWLLGRRLSSPLAGGLAAVLLLVNFGQVWFARFPLAEPMTQYLLLSGLYFTVLSLDGGRPVIGFLAGTAFGLAAFCRIDVLFVATPIVAIVLAIIARLQGFSRVWRSYAAGLILVSVHASAHALGVAQAYTGRVLAELFRTPRLTIRAALLPAIILVAALAITLALETLRKRRGRIRSARILGLAIAVILAYRLGPRLLSGYFGMILSPVGIIAAFGGLTMLMTRDASLRSLPIVALFLGSALIYFESTRDVVVMPLLFRRYIPLLLPLSMLFVGHLVARIWGTAGRFRGLVLVLPAVLGALFVIRILPILKTPPMQGAYLTVQQLANAFPRDSLLLLDSSTPNHLALSLDYTFDRDSLAVQRYDHRSSALRDVVGQALATSRRVYVITRSKAPGGGDSLWRSDLEGFVVQSRGIFPLQYAAMQLTRQVLPWNILAEEYILEVYQVLAPNDAAARVSLPLKADIGAHDFAHVLRGFHALESMPSATARWMQAEAQVALPPVAVPDGRDIALSLRLAAYRPPGIAAPTATLRLNGTPIGQISGLGPGFSIYRLTLPGRLLDKSGNVLTLEADTFIPQEAGLGFDARVLSAALDWVVLEEDQSPTPERTMGTQQPASPISIGGIAQRSDPHQHR